ncbi:MAG: alpha/beta fold hydrolase [bacterium]|nr:alpha/beta fold hydrolase [bacterium]
MARLLIQPRYTGARAWVCAGAWLAVVGFAGLAPAQVQPAELAPAQVSAAPAATAESFATAVVARDGAAARALGDAKLAAAMTDATISQIMAAVTAQIGTITGTDAAWLETAESGFTHHRVALRGEKGNLDFQVVVDGNGHVAGLWLKPHQAAPGTPAEATATDEGPQPRQVEVSVGPADSALPGILTLPEGDGPFPAVVLVHGSGPSDRDGNVSGNRPYRDIANGLATKGVATLRYDKRSFANPRSLMAHGAAMTVQHESIDDAVAAVALLRTRPEIDPARVYVLGHSLGGMVAPRIAGQAKADGMIILAGATRPLPEVVLEQVRYIAAVDDTLTMDEVIENERMAESVKRYREAPAGTGTFMGLPAGYLADLEAHDAPAEAAALDIPVLVLQGARDYQVTMEDFRRWQAALRPGPRTCYKVYGDLDHLMRAGEGKSKPADYTTPRPVAPMVIEDIARFVQQGCASPRR